MKKTFVFGAISTGLVLLSGCASNGSSRYANQQRFVVDQAYVDAVDHASRRAGVQVTWVNPPTKRMSVAADSTN